MNKQTESKSFTVFNQRLAGLLMYKGFVLISMEKSKTDQRRNVFFFNDTDALRKEVENFKKSR